MDWTVVHPQLGDIKLLGSLLKLSVSPVVARESLQLFGQHSREVLGEIEYEIEEIQKLIE